MKQAGQAQAFGVAVASVASHLTPTGCHGGISLWKTVNAAIALAVKAPAHASDEPVEAAANTALAFPH